MSRREPSSEIDLQALFDSGREVPRQPEAVRARVLARARATAAAPMLQPAPVPAHPRLPRYVVAPAAAAALALGIVGAVYALSGRWSHPGVPGGAASVAGGPSPVITASSAAELPVPGRAGATSMVEAEPSVRTEPAQPRTRGPAERQAAYDAELRLMRSAHTAYAAHAFANALVLVGEHARRFPAGLLAEEREALRVRCLLGSGRTAEAQRAAAAFATRFPRSVLLQRIQGELGTTAR
ncbi:MAG TPA: hypothetical protein VLJ38_21800 [Polyangiaceae bacterium]|nr:hypothetical protein [Polyangiaceae bacterium]